MVFVWIPVDVNAQPDYNSAMELLFAKENSEEILNDLNTNEMTSSFNDRQNDGFERDQMLIGSWRYTESYTSGDFSMVTEKYMEVRPDGTYSYGNGIVAGGGNAGSFGSGGGDAIHGKWRTENGLIFVDYGYGQWELYSGYYIEGNKLMLKFNNGSREIWDRMY